MMGALLGLACAGAPGTVRPGLHHETDVYRRAELERISRLEREIERLRADLAEAEHELVAVESGLRGVSSRADAISALAEARLQLERATERAPWRASLLKEAEEKLSEAERLVEAENFGSAIFFASRAERIARNTLAEVKEAESEPGARSVVAPRVNLRDGPSRDHAVVAVLHSGLPVFPEREAGDWMLVRTADGFVGWIHRSLIR
jgi:hypothetical protein